MIELKLNHIGLGWALNPLTSITIRKGASLVAQRLKRLPAMQEIRVRSLGWEDPLGKEMAIHASILAWRILHGWRSLVGYSPRGRKESTQLSDFTFTVRKECEDTCT